MKRWICLLLTAALLLSLAGCSAGGETPADSTATDGGAGTSAPNELQPTDTDSPQQPPRVEVLEYAPPELFGVGTPDTGEIGKPGVDFTLPETGDATDWGEEPAPLFNPLGSAALYSSTDHAPLSGITLYTLNGYEQQQRTLYGEYWCMYIYDMEQFSAEWLRWYADSLDAEQLSTTPDNLTFHIVKSETVEWWVSVTDIREGYGCRIEMVRTDLLPAGKTITLDAAYLQSHDSLCFYTHRTPGKKQSAEVVLTPGGERTAVDVSLQARLDQGEVRWDTSAYYSLSIENGDRMTMDDLPISPVDLYWELRWDNTDARYLPDRITFTVSEMDSVQEIAWGTSTGAIRVVGAPPGQAQAYATGNGTSISHRGMGVSVDYQNPTTSVPDAEGNALIPLPAGYYEVQVGGNILAPEDPGSTYRLIPVSAGKITELTVPADLKAAYEQLARKMADFDKQTGGIDILDAKDGGETATVSLLVNDPAKRDVFPEPADFQITEYGLPGQVLEVKREPAQSNVVLVLDSSGSMGEHMVPTVAAAKRFVESLPDQTAVQLVQFQQTITVHPGATKADALAALDKVRSIGATSLYDATDTALGLLAGKERAFAVVFSDGADSREPGIDGTGSTQNTKEQIIQKIADSGVTVLTIGFGKGHDPGTLIQMGDASATGNGGYFAAADAAALDSAFAAVAGKFGNQFTITYRRPTQTVDVASSVPAVSVMLDISGSMSPYLNNIRTLLHDFVLEMPQDTLMQFAAFSDGADYLHASSYERAALLQAVGMSERAQGGGTNVPAALQATYEMLAPLPTVKKNAVFITDEALDAGEEVDKLLVQLKDAGIRTLFLALSEDNNERMTEIFSHAAEMAGGEYLITTDLAKIQAKVDEMLAQVNVPLREENGMQLGVSLDCLTEDGTRMSYSAVQLLDAAAHPFAARENAGATLRPATLAITQTDEPYVLYDAESAAKLSGESSPGEDTLITARVDLDTGADGEAPPQAQPAESEPAESQQPPTEESTVTQTVKAGFTGSNQVATLTVKEAYFLDKLQGLTPDKNKQFLALDIEMAFDNKTETAFEEYQIPTILNHFFVSVNGSAAPASEATWLAGTPLVTPGTVELILTPGRSKSGMLVFMIERTAQEYVGQLALHFYDTEQGHIQIPIIGTLPQELVAIEDLPKNEPTRITDAFSLTVTGSADVDKLAGVQLHRENYRDDPNVAREASFRVLEGRFDSQVQALLNIDPMQRFLYAIDTDCGPLVVKMSNVVYSLPMGFTGETLLAPGSVNPVRMPFQIANELTGASSYLFGDLSNSVVHIPVTQGSAYATGSLGLTYSHEYFDLTVNALSVHPDSSSRVILDFTITDKKDGYGLGGVGDIFTLERLASEGDNVTLDAKGKATVKAATRKGLGDFASDELVAAGQLNTPDMDYTAELLYGAVEPSGEWAVYDGMSRRGLLVFYANDDPTLWALTSPYFEELQLTPSAGQYAWPALLAQRQEVERDEDYQQLFDEAVSAAVTRWQAANPPAESSYETIGMAETEQVPNRTAAPSAAAYGKKLLESVQTDADFRNLMNSLTWLPGDSSCYYRSPEVTLTQGWGTETDLAETARALLAAMGRSPSFKKLTLLELGEENLLRMAGYDGASVGSAVYAISYTDEAGTPRLYVPVFRRDITELTDLCYLPLNADSEAPQPVTGNISITVRGRLTAEKLEDSPVGGMGDFGGLFGSLAGETEDTGPNGEVYETVTLFERSDLDLTVLGTEPIDISYVSAGKSENGADDLVIAALDTADGILTDTSCFIDTAYYDIQSVTVELYTSGTSNASESRHTTYLTDGQKLTNVMQTLVWGAAELTEKAAADMQADSALTVQAEGEVTDAYSIVRWNTHQTAAKLVRALARFDEENEEKLGVKAARITNPLIFMVTARSDGQDAMLSVDLMDHRNQILYAESDQAALAYNTLLGFFASQAEAQALPDGRGRSYVDVWATLPADAQFLQVNADMEERTLAAAALRKNGFPEVLCSRLENDNLVSSSVGFIIPNAPGLLDGQPHWAWLEMDAYTGDVISVFDTGERMGMASYLLGLTPKNSVEFTAGALVGIACSHFSVAAYALETDDYAQIMESAAALSVYAYQRISQTMEGVDKLKDPVGTATEALKNETNAAIKESTGIDVLELYNLYKNGPEGAIEGAIKDAAQVPEPNFTEGFKAVVEAYYGVTIE